MFMKLIKIVEDMMVTGDQVKLVKPYDSIKKYNIDGRTVYSLFGDVNYYDNRESILAIKGKSNVLKLNGESYSKFLLTLKDRFYSIKRLAGVDQMVSLETSSNINDDIMYVIGKPYVKDGFKKVMKDFKMRSIPKDKRSDISGLFSVNFDMGGSICVVDDFITTGSSFRNAFSLIPIEVPIIGVCLFRFED